MRRCSKCGETKPDTEWYPASLASGGYCKRCSNAYAVEHRRASGRVAKPSRSTEQNKEYMRLYRITKVYGLTVEEYETLLIRQGGVCAICQGISPNGQALHIDHDHSCCGSGRSCGKCVRGLLCANCNKALGLLRDSPTLLNKASAYLTKETI